jgi:NAD+ synthase/NAD+ synthase (glutamine-hydrolysing)
VKIALLQIDPTVGDLEGNAQLIAEAVREAAAAGADLAVTPELALVGYLPRDLLLSAGFVARSWDRLHTLGAELKGGPPTLVGLPEPNQAEEGRPLFNTAALVCNGLVAHRFRKALLPTYDVFDEDRYFEPFHGAQILELKGHRLGISICEDIWNDRDFWKRRRYHHDPVEELVRAGSEAIVNLSASPFTVGKHRRREEMLASMARKYAVPLVYVNQYGGNDDLVFDGRSCGFAATGEVVARGRSFERDVLICNLSGPPIGPPTDLEPESEVWRALVLGTRDYARKCGFSRVVLGLSGGIDSALTAAIAVEALGPSNVLGVLMPSPFSSRGSIDDSLTLSKNLGIATEVLPIADAMAAIDGITAKPFAGSQRDVTEENIQARIRGTLLMALSNKRRALLLTTGNKSELAVGYCTLYGDMSGGLGVIADVPKTMVYRIARWLNARSEAGPVIPLPILTKAPSAELRPNQTDQDTLPPYDVLDAILERHVERHEPADVIVAAGFDAATVRRVLSLVRGAEFKRKQAAPGLKVTDRAFGTGWRMPIAARVKD